PAAGAARGGVPRRAAVLAAARVAPARRGPLRGVAGRGPRGDPGRGGPRPRLRRRPGAPHARPPLAPRRAAPPTNREPPPAAAVRAGVAVVSAAALSAEIAFTRIFSIALWHHFAYLVVGLALLGFGAAGARMTARGGALLPEDGPLESALARRSR